MSSKKEGILWTIAGTVLCLMMGAMWQFFLVDYYLGQTPATKATEKGMDMAEMIGLTFGICTVVCLGIARCIYLGIRTARTDSYQKPTAN